MKNKHLEHGDLGPTAEQVERAREELRKRLKDEELECVRQEAMNGLISHLRIDAKSFRRFWIGPLIEAGATLDMALACIVQSCFQPN